IAILETHFWSEEEGALRESLSRDWQREEAYRGANSNMHATETFLALADATGDEVWLLRALRIAERLIHGHATANGQVVVEHFDWQWQALPDYNEANRADPFRPYGSTPGHSFEWARLLLHLEAALRHAGLAAPEWLLDDACGLFARASRDAWNADGKPGLVYTLDWASRPVVCARLHWVHAEAIAVAATLLRRTGEPSMRIGIAASGSSPRPISSICSAAAGTMNSTATTGRQAASGPANQISITPIRPCCCRACLWRRAWRPPWLLCNGVVTYTHPFVTSEGDGPT